MGNRFKEGDLVVTRGPSTVPPGEIGTVIKWEMRTSSPGARGRPRRYYTVLWSSVGLRHNVWSSEIKHIAD